MQNSIQTQFIYFQVESEKLFKKLLKDYNKGEETAETEILKSIKLFTYADHKSVEKKDSAIIDYGIDLYANQFLSYCIVPKVLNSEYQVRFTNIFFQQGIESVVRNVAEVRELIQISAPLSFVFQGNSSIPSDSTYSFSLQVEIKHKDIITRFQIDPKLKAKQSQ